MARNRDDGGCREVVLRQEMPAKPGETAEIRESYGIRATCDMEVVFFETNGETTADDGNFDGREHDFDGSSNGTDLRNHPSIGFNRCFQLL